MISADTAAAAAAGGSGRDGDEGEDDVLPAVDCTSPTTHTHIHEGHAYTVRHSLTDDTPYSCLSPSNIDGS